MHRRDLHNRSSYQISCFEKKENWQGRPMEKSEQQQQRANYEADPYILIRNTKHMKDSWDWVPY